MPVFISIIFAVVIFAIGTAEIGVANIAPILAQEFGVNIPQIGYLTSIWALSMAIGGIVLNFALLKFSKKKSLLTLIFIFLIGNIFAIFAHSYLILVISRIMGGASFGVLIGYCLAVAVNLSQKEFQGKVAGIVASGFMFAAAFGSPLFNLFAQTIGWRYGFGFIAILTVMCVIFILLKVPQGDVQKFSFKEEFVSFKSSRLWMVYFTSMLIVGSAFAGYTYFVSIYEEVLRLDRFFVPILLMLYGIGMITGNFVVAKLAHKYAIKTEFFFLILLGVCFISFAIFTHFAIVAIVCTFGIGFFGISQNPAMITRAARVSNNSGSVNVFHAIVVNVGIFLGSYLGGLSIDLGFGFISPLWLGFIMAIVGAISVAPYLQTKI